MCKSKTSHVTHHVELNMFKANDALGFSCVTTFKSQIFTKLLYIILNSQKWSDFSRVPGTCIITIDYYIV